MAGQPNIVLRRNDSVTVDQLSPGEYLPISKRDWQGDRAWVGWCCPRCCKALLLLRAVHQVDFDGVVSPGVNCPDATCSLAGDVVLADWVPEPLGYA